MGAEVTAGGGLEYRYTWGTTEIRVLVGHDVVGWSMGGFGGAFPVAQFERDGRRLPGPSADERRALASCVARALEAARDGGGGPK
jgi:hypothetical protein